VPVLSMHSLGERAKEHCEKFSQQGVDYGQPTNEWREGIQLFV